MQVEKIKPVPKYILKLIRKADDQRNLAISGNTRYYSYLTKNDGELVKVTVAVKSKHSKWYYKQCAVHGIDSKECFVKDMYFTYIAGYTVGWFSEGLTKYPKWYERDHWGYASDKDFDMFAPVVNMDYLGKQKKYKYSAWQLYAGERILQYLRLYEKYPQLEYLMKAGLQLYYSSKQILAKVGKDKKFAKWLIQNKQALTRRKYYVDVILRSYSSGKPLDALQHKKERMLSFAHDAQYKNIKNTLPKEKLSKVADYLVEKDISTYTYYDYLKACNYLKLDLTQDKNAFPHNFQHWHDIRIDEYHTAKALADEKERKELYEKFKGVAMKYIGLQQDKKGYVVIIAMSPQELVREGEILHHCVGKMGYDQKFVREDSLIFFVRQKDEPEKPFVTVEYSPNKHRILQVHGLHNSTPDATTMKYIQKTWLPFANKTVRQMAAA